MEFNAKSSIPNELIALRLPAIHDVIVMSGAAMELYSLRKAQDIDVVTTRQNIDALFEHSDGWREGARNVLPSGIVNQQYTDILSRFDIWLDYWFDDSLEEIRTQSVQHPLGFWVVTKHYLRQRKEAADRDKDRLDLALLD